ncbi:uncharacterized protein LOC126898131 [Daktulosphaira vitifoliae]|uniref:uncharacterized protein LOC126898131 n=1 Tax=Daktulosphaira vitifoliae TaxID=58002 RepID=UPI0021AABE42|nr:uncharacterized protein LOC126898131 [Daktulosphaira vitifoliae]
MKTKEEHLVNDKLLTEFIPYREAVGSLLYLSTISRPDISIAVNYLSRYCNKPMQSHWKLVKRVFQYLKGTIMNEISFNRDDKIFAYSDADCAGEPVTHILTSGVLILRGGPIVWFTQKQSLVTKSTSEAEYRGAISSIDDICWIRRIGNELGFVNPEESTTLFVDNKSLIHMLQNVHEGKSIKGKKHIEIKRKFIQQHIGQTIEVKHVRSCDQLADILTKPLTAKPFVNICNKIIKVEC